MNAKRASLVAIFFFLLFAGCGGQLYKVTPLPSNTKPEISTSAGSLSLGALALSGDQTYQHFEANLQLAGVIAVDVRLVNREAEPISANTLKFELRDSTNARFKQLAPRKALDKVIKYYGDRVYTLESRRRTRESYEAIALKTDGTIAPQEERRGILFFEGKRDAINFDGLTLTLSGASMPVSVQLEVK